MNLCLNCSKDTKNAKYCNRSCAAKQTNKIPKVVRKIPRCIICKIEIKRRNKYCNSCRPTIISNYDWSQITYKQLEIMNGKVQRRVKIHELARKIYKKKYGKGKCFVCGYEKHCEICHIKAIKDFRDDSFITEINDIENLVALCPNHHWEFDNGLICLE